jgi:hypothetical protein
MGKMPHRPIPTLILVFFVVDLALVLGHLFTSWTVPSTWMLARFLNVRRELNLPTWYSSIQWFCVASLFGIFAHHHFSRSQKQSWLLGALPLLFLAFSLDEMAEIHEWIGHKSDSLLPSSSRKGGLFDSTGIWMLVLGGPFLIFFAGLMLSLRTFFRLAPSALMKVLLGMAVMLVGALDIEILENSYFIGSARLHLALQAAAEELCEMVGSTIVLWGSYELLYSHGFTWRFDHVQTP